MDRRIQTESRLTNAIACLACGMVFFYFIAYNFIDIDLWHQMALTRASVKAGHLLTSDVFAYTPVIEPWIDHEWGAGMVAYALSTWFGWRSLVILKFALALAAGAISFRCSRARGASYSLIAICAFPAIYLAHLGFLPVLRAHTYTFVFCALWLWALDCLRDQYPSRRGAALALLVIFPVWVNLHAGFVVGIGFTVLAGIEQLLRRQSARLFFLLASAMTIEIAINPYGLHYFAYLRRALVMPRPFIPEWGSVWTLGSSIAACFVATILVAAWALWKNRLANSPGVLVLIAAAAEAALHRKMLPIFAIAWLCYVPAWLQFAVGERRFELASRRPKFVLALWLWVGLAFGIAALRAKPWALDLPPRLYPVGAVEYLSQAHFHGNLMTPFRSGAFVSWKLYPDVRVSLDSRYEVAYPDDLVKRMFDFYAGREGWRQTLTACNTDVVLVGRDDAVAKLMASTDWKQIYEDQYFELFAKPEKDELPARK